MRFSKSNIRHHREQKEKQEAKDRYWKVCDYYFLLVGAANRLSSCSSTSKAKPTRLKLT